MSGGVDSSVAAALLLKEGHEVIGAFMKNWSEAADPCSGDCGWHRERADAVRTAAHLGIPLETLDFEEQYRREVVDYMIREYASGRTPNPDVMCNRMIKFGPFLETARRLHCDAMATGHYARVAVSGGPGVRGSGGAAESATYRLLVGVDPNKDQSYFLHRLNQEQLRQTLFPIGHLLKPQVRELAKEFGLPNADKKDSQGICFIGKVKLEEFLAGRIEPKPGIIVTVNHEAVGRHDGLAHFTVGQRHGLGLGGGEPYFVVRKDMATNTLYVARGSDHPALFSKELVADDIHWISGAAPSMPFECQARIRYRQPLQNVTVVAGERPGTLKVAFAVPQRAVSPGQFCVFYQGDECLGGAVIC